ncbi:probable basic-leucine zipper transcription factor Q [Biomphalaria glabrata]|uniref:Probable basic-leucine zipper transcription factor Q n=1 Tax=Biomphalaria glabrata TaxID=6526 RepID=A0A9W3A5G6_BIOGL|nr:probable basic-leucine zipper transcription factor Q [Biomphalaria glabrata]
MENNFLLPSTTSSAQEVSENTKKPNGKRKYASSSKENAKNTEDNSSGEIRVNNYEEVRRSKSKKLKGLSLERADQLRIKANQQSLLLGGTWERERQRILNEALHVLKRMDIPLFPNVSGNKVGSKCHTVKNATAYIIHMMRQIEEHDRTHGVSAHLHQQSQLHQQRLQKQLEAMQQEELQYQLQQQQLYQEMLLQQSPQQQNHKQQNPQDSQQKQIQTPESQPRLCQQLDSQLNLHHQQSHVKLEPQHLKLDQQQQTQELQLHCDLQQQMLHQTPQFDHKPQLNQEQQQQQLLFQQLQKTLHHQPQIQSQQHRSDQHIPPLLKHKQSQLLQHQKQKPQYEPKQEHLYPQVQAQQPRQPKLGLLLMAQQNQQQAQLIQHFGKYHKPETYSFDVPKQHGSLQLTPRFNSKDLPGLRHQVLPMRPNEQVKSIYPHPYSQWKTNHLVHPTFTLQHNPTPSTQPRQTWTPVPEGNFVAQLNPMNQAQCSKGKPKCNAKSTKTKETSQATENTEPFARQLQSSTLCTENNISKQKRISGNTINFTAFSGSGNHAGVNSKKNLRIAFNDKTNIVLNENNLSAFSAPTFDLCYPTADPRASCSTSSDISRATERHAHDANKEHPNSDIETTDWLLDFVSVDQYFESLQN